MKFTNALITAFVGSTNRNSAIDITSPPSRSCSARPLGLIAPTAIEADLATNNLAAPVHTLVAGQSKDIHVVDMVEGSPRLLAGIREWLVPSANAAETAAPPTQEEIKLLREAFATFYGLDRDLVKSEKLLTQVVDAWQRQAPDEKAGLYRVRGDCYMVRLCLQ